MKKLKAACLSACALFAASAALGADLKPVHHKRVVAVPVADWTGLYVGANAGGSIGVDSTTDTGVLTSPFPSPFGVGPVGTNVMFNESFRHSPAEQSWGVSLATTGRSAPSSCSASRPTGREPGSETRRPLEAADRRRILGLPASCRSPLTV